MENKLKLLITKERESEIKKFEKLFSSHIYAIATDDFEFENYVRNVIPACQGVRETTGSSGHGKTKKTTGSTIQVKDTSQDIFKKKEVAKKGVAKAFSKTEQKSSSVKKEASEKTTVKKEVHEPKQNQKVNSFFGKKTETKPKKIEKKKSSKKIEHEVKAEDEEMEVDQKEAEEESEDEPVAKKRKSPRKKTKHRRIQMESSSDDEENEGDKLLFGDSQEERLKNISLDDDKMLAEDTIRSDDSDHEGLPSDEMSEEEKENKQKKMKKEKTQFGSAKVIGGDQVQTKNIKKKRYTVDDEGNMVTETYYVKEEMTNDEIEKQKKEDEKRKSPANPKKIVSKSSAASSQKSSMKQKSISSFFKPKSK